MTVISRVWLRMAFLFDPVQYFFNGSFWDVFLQQVGDLTKSRILDLGCGTGEFRRYITPKSYLGVDLNSYYIKHARKRHNLESTEFTVGDITTYIPTEPFDMAFLISCAHHLSDQQISAVCQTIKNTEIKMFVIADGFPIGPFSNILSWLDASLGGGRYFRQADEIVQLIEPHFKVVESGTLTVTGSYYNYPYLIARNDQ